MKLLANFRNAPAMIRTLRGGPACQEAVTWDGVRLRHPDSRRGLVETIVEVWLEGGYCPGGFYRPAPGDVVLDVGANVGIFAVALARAEPGCRVVAVEPCDENFACLRANLEAAAPGRAVAHRLAVGRARGVGRMVSASTRSLDYRLEGDGGDAEGGPPVEVVSLAELVATVGADRIALMKMDIEGSERDAIESAPPEVLGRIDHLALEYHDNIRPGTLDALRRHLEPTHELRIISSHTMGCGILLGVSRDLAAAGARRPDRVA